MTFTAILTGSRLYQERFKHRLSALPITYDLQTVGCLLQQGSERIIIDLLSGRNFDGFRSGGPSNNASGQSRPSALKIVKLTALFATLITAHIFRFSENGAFVLKPFRNVRDRAVHKLPKPLADLHLPGITNGRNVIRNFLIHLIGSLLIVVWYFSNSTLMNHLPGHAVPVYHFTVVGSPRRRANGYFSVPQR